jgi:hypothetical protein
LPILFIVAVLSASACGGAGKPQFPHLRTSSSDGDGPPPDMRVLTLPDTGTFSQTDKTVAGQIDDSSNLAAPEYQSPPVAGGETYREWYDFNGIEINTLQYASYGFWVDNASLANYAYFSDNAVLPPRPAAGLGRVTYEVEGEFFYTRAPSGEFEFFYSEGEFTADFDAATISGEMAVTAATDGNFFEADTRHNNYDATNDITNSGITLTFSNGVITENGVFNGEVSASAADAAGAWLPHLDGASGGAFDGAFYDDPANYDNTAATPAELSGKFQLPDGDGNTVIGGFAGRQEE